MTSPNGDSAIWGTSGDGSTASLCPTTWPNSGFRPSVTIVIMYIRRAM